MEHITNEQLSEQLKDHIEQHSEDTKKILHALYGDGKENLGLVKQQKEITDLLTGIKFLPVILRGLLMVGGLVGMVWAAVLALKSGQVK